jgi:hypothetical protein
MSRLRQTLKKFQKSLKNILGITKKGLHLQPLLAEVLERNAGQIKRAKNQK